MFAFDQLKPDYLKLNPDGVVPTLVCDGEPIRESMIINEFIDRAFPGPQLIPANPIWAARMKEFIRTGEQAITHRTALTIKAWSSCPMSNFAHVCGLAVYSPDPQRQYR